MPLHSNQVTRFEHFLLGERCMPNDWWINWFPSHLTNQNERSNAAINQSDLEAKTCNPCPVSAGKHATSAKCGKTSNACQARETREPSFLWLARARLHVSIEPIRELSKHKTKTFDSQSQKASNTWILCSWFYLRMATHWTKSAFKMATIWLPRERLKYSKYSSLSLNASLYFFLGPAVLSIVCFSRLRVL